MLDCTFIKSNIFKHFSDQYSYAGATACTDCPAGYSCASASVAPVRCALGEYSAAACKYTTFIIPPPMTKGAFKLTSPSLWRWHIVFILSVHPSILVSVCHNSWYPNCYILHRNVCLIITKWRFACHYSSLIWPFEKGIVIAKLRLLPSGEQTTQFEIFKRNWFIYKNIIW